MHQRARTRDPALLASTRPLGASLSTGWWRWHAHQGPGRSASPTKIVSIMSIDPSTILAMSLSAHKGIYALLLGSGISRSAGIPTGWEVVQDLIRRVAILEKADPEPDPAAWYESRFGKPARYSELVQMLAPHPAERMSLLREYFEPTEADREQGRKLPTAAHLAIANLVARGAIRVIVTTNFDRLLERALESAGVHPTVVASSDQVKGMLPLPHVQCLVFKVHGDYLDTRIRNTPEELAAYDVATNRLLNRVLTEFGLVVCGWSAEWDVALADAIARNTRFRFSTYWLAKGDLSERARDLIAHRHAIVVPVEGADQAFAHLDVQVDALTTGRMAAPISASLAVSAVKKFLSEPKHRIQLEELVTRELNEAMKATSSRAMPLGDPKPEKKSYVDRVHRMEAACGKLAASVAAGAYWDRGEFDSLWCRCAAALASGEVVSGTTYDWWDDLRYYPSTLILYSAGIPAMLRGRLDLLRKLLAETTFRRYPTDEPRPLVERALSCAAIDNTPGQFLHDRESSKSKLRTPGSDWLVRRLPELLVDVLPGDFRFEEVFDDFEFLVAMVTADVLGKCHIGRFGWHSPDRVFRRVVPDVEKAGESHPILTAGLFQGDLARFQAALAMTREWRGRMDWP